MNGMSVKNFCNETLSKTNFPLGRIKVHLILSYLIYNILTMQENTMLVTISIIFSPCKKNLCLLQYL